MIPRIFLVLIYTILLAVVPVLFATKERDLRMIEGIALVAFIFATWAFIENGARTSKEEGEEKQEGK